MRNNRAHKIHLPKHGWHSMGNDRWEHRVYPGLLVYRKDADILRKVEACHCLTKGEKEYLRYSLELLNYKENASLDLAASEERGEIYGYENVGTR